MNITVISPHAVNNGNTTVASLIALELSARGKKVCLTHTKTKSSSIYNYFGLNDVEEDKTANPSRLVKMLKEQVLKTEDISDYCRSISPTLEIFSANDVRFAHEDMMYALEFIVKYFPHEYVVFDMDDNELDSPANQLVLKKSDFILIVMNQSIKEVDAFKRNAKSIFKSVGNKPMCMVINNYSKDISKPNDFAASIGIKDIKKSSSWLYIRHNPYIAKYENKGDLSGFYKSLRNGDYRIIDVAEDIKNIVNRIMKFKQANRAQKVDEALKANQALIKDTEDKTNSTKESQKQTKEDVADKIEQVEESKSK